MANDGRSGSIIKDAERNSLKKNHGNGKGTSVSGSGENGTSPLRRSAGGTSSSQQVTPSPPSIRKSGRLMNHIPLSPSIMKKSARIGKQITLTPSKRADRGKKEISPVNRSEDVKSSTGTRERRTGYSFRALFKTQKRIETAPVPGGDGIKDSNSDPIVDKTLVDATTEDHLRTAELVGSASIGHSFDDGVDLGSRDNIISSERKRDEMVSVDASARNSGKDGYTSNSDDVCSSSGCKTHDASETCVSCSKRHRSKRQKSDHDSQRQDFCSCETELNKDAHEINIPEQDLGQSEDSAPTEVAEKCDGMTPLNNTSLDIQTDVNENSCIICKLGGKLMFCDGKDCKRSYHPACLDPPLDEFPPVNWHCSWCVNKKTQPSVDSENSSRFVEFWVPSQISNVQLEQYLQILLANSMSLRLRSKTGHAGALRNILFSARKCLDHPYTVDHPSLKASITKGLPAVDFLGVEIKASGKLQLLEAILSEMKNRQQRVLVLFQSIGGSGRDSMVMGDVLDDFLHERYGADTYERVDGGAISKRRQAALNNFNNDRGKFVFLLETRTCLQSIRPSIRLSSVDAIVIFNSDWNPANDVKALHKISVDSQVKAKQIKIFRLYSSCTVEEKVLILAKQGLPLESKLENISCAISDLLLMWGASYLFNRLDEFHSSSDSDISPEESFLEKVVEDLSVLLSKNGESNYINYNSIVLEVQQKGGAYSSNDLKLPGELQIQLLDGEQPQDFWTDLLRGRNPRWKFLSGERHHKKVQYFDKFPKKPNAETVAVGKKRKVVTNCVTSATLEPGLGQSEVAVVGEGPSRIPADNESYHLDRSDAFATNALHTSNYPIVGSGESTPPDEQSHLYALVKPDISKLCEILKFSDEVKLMVGQFLKYVFANHQVHREPRSILQAFLISLCWIAASLVNEKIDRKESLSLARNHLNFECNEEEANLLYSEMRKLKRTFRQNNNMETSDFSKNSISGAEDVTKGPLSEKASLSVPPCTIENGKFENITDKRVLLLQQTEAPNDVLQPENAPSDRHYKKILRKCEKRMSKLLKEQKKDREEFLRDWEDKREAFETEHRMESAIFCEMYTTVTLRSNQLKVLDYNLAKKMEELECQKESFEAKQLAEVNAEKEKQAHWLELARSSSAIIESRGQDEVAVYGSGSLGEEQGPDGIMPVDNCGENDKTEGVSSVTLNVEEKQIPDGLTILSGPGEMTPPKRPERIPEEVLGGADSVLEETPDLEFNGENDITEGVSSVTPNAVDKQTPDRLMLSGPVEMTPLGLSDRIPVEVMGSADSAGTGTQAVEFNGENERINGVSFVTLNAAEKKTSDEFLLSRPSEMTPPELPERIPQQVMGSADSVGMGAPAVELNGENERTDGVSSVILSGPCEMTPSELPVRIPEQVMGNADSSGMETPAVELDGENNRTDGVSSITPNAAENPSQNGEANSSAESVLNPPVTPACDHSVSQTLVENTGDLPSNQCTPNIGTNVDLNPSTNSTEIHNQADVASAIRLGHQPSGELNTSFLNAEFLPLVVEGTTELPNQAVFHPGGNRFNVQEFNNLPPLHGEHQVPSQVASLHSCGDPLQKELERLCKETEQITKTHEEMKVRLIAEREEIIARIRRTYEAKLKDAEADFMLKKTELDKNQNKVLMNKILADAFKSKCLDIGPSRPMGTQKAGPPGFTQHLCQLPLHPSPRPSSITVSSPAGQPSQQNMAPRRVSQPASRLHPISVSSSASQPAASQQNTAPRASPVSASSSAGQPAAASHQSTPPPLQIVRQSAALFSSSTLTRPPQINPITPGNLRAGSDFRAPAPHLQPFRPAGTTQSVNFASPLPGMMPSHPTSSSLPTPPLANYTGGISNNISPLQSNITARGMSIHGLSTIILENLWRINSQQGPQNPNVSNLPDLGSRLTSRPAGISNDNVVCLSDDES